MTQSRTQSALETTLNIGSGYLLAMATQAVLYPLYGIHTSTAQDAGIAAVFTAVSLVRSYVWRRIFNRLGHRAKPAEVVAPEAECPECRGVRDKLAAMPLEKRLSRMWPRYCGGDACRHDPEWQYMD